MVICVNIRRGLAVKIFRVGKMISIIKKTERIRILSLFMALLMALSTINVEATSLWNQAENLEIAEAIDLGNEIIINGDGTYDGEKLTFENNNLYAGASAFTRYTYSLNSDDEGMSFASSFSFSINNVDESLGKGGFAFMVKGSNNQEYSKAENTIGTGSIEKSLAIGIESSYWNFDDDPYIAYTVSVIRNGDYKNPIFQDTTANVYLDKPIEDGEVIRSYITYDDETKDLYINLDGMQLGNNDVCSFDVPNVDISSIFVDDDGEVIKDVYIGFTGATGDAQESCSIYDWYFDNNSSFTDSFYAAINTNAIEDYKWLDDHLYTDILNGNNSFNEITDDLYLPSKLPLGTKVVWESCAPLLINNSGNVNRPFIEDDGIESGLCFYVINPLGVVIDENGNEIDAESDYIGFTVLRNDENLEGEKVNSAVYLSSGIDVSESLKSFGGGEIANDNTIAIKKDDENNLEASVFTANRLFFGDDYSFSTYFSFNDSSLEIDRGEAGTGGFAFNILGSGNQLGDAEGSLGTNNMASSLNIGIVSKYDWKTKSSSTSQGEYYCDKNYFLSVFSNGDYNNPLVYEEIDGPYIGSGKDMRCEINYDGINKTLNIKMIQTNYIGDTSYEYTYEKTVEDMDLSDILIDEEGNKTQSAFVGFSGGTALIEQTFNITKWFFASGDTDIYETNKVLEDTSLMDITSSNISYTTGSAIKIKVSGNPDTEGNTSPVQGAKVDVSTSKGQVYPSQIITDSFGEGECILLSENDVDATISAGVHGGIFKEENIAVAGYGSELQDTYMVDAVYDWLNEDIIKNGNTSINDIRTDVKMPRTGPYGSVITWTISDELVIDDSGSVSRPEPGDGNDNVTLGATILVGGASIEKYFELTISEKSTSYGLLLDEDYDSLTEEVIAKDNRSLDQVMSDLYLPTVGGNGSSIAWESSSDYELSTDGSIDYYYLLDDAYVTLTATLTMGEQTITKEFEVTLHANPNDDSQKLWLDDEWFYIDKYCQVPDEDNNVQLQLPTRGKYGSIIEWESSNEDIITSDGTVYRPTEGDAYQYVDLTATLRKGSETVEKQTSVAVKKTEFTQEDIVDLDYEALNQYVIRNDNSDLSHIVTNLNLPIIGAYNSTIVWQSSNNESISTKGVVNRNAYNEEDEAVTLTATISYGTATPRTKTFEVLVLKKEATDQEAVNEMSQAFHEEDFLNGNEDLTNVKTDLYMPTSGIYDTTLVWTSSDEALVDIDGKVVRPSFFDNDKQVLISLEIRRGSASIQRQYEIMVNKINYSNDEIVNRDFDALDFDSIKNENLAENSIVGNLILETTGKHGSTISWESSSPEIISANGEVTSPTYLEEDSTVSLTATIGYGESDSKVKTFELTVLKKEMTDSQCIYEALKSLTNETILNGNVDFENITSDLSLPTDGLYDTKLSWQTSNAQVVTSDGRVIRPDYTEMDKSVTLTVDITKGAEVDTISYELVVKAEKITDEKAVQNAWKYLTYEVLLGDVSKNEVIDDINLPTSYDNDVVITWTSSNTGVIKIDGTVIRPKEYNMRGVNVTLNTTITCGTVSYTNRFYLTVSCMEDDYVKHITSDPRPSNENVAYTKQEITIDFDKNINLTKYKDNIKIEKYNDRWSNYDEVESNLATENERLTIILQEGLIIGGKYKVTIPDNSINSDSGYYLQSDIVYDFTVENQKYIGGFIESTSIKDGQTNVDIIGQVFDVRFSEYEFEDVSDSEIEYYEGDSFSDIKVVNKNTKQEIGLYGCMIVGKGLRIGINPLEAGETYEIFVPSGAVVDYYGNSNFPVDVTFATREDLASPKITSVYPGDGSENVDINQEIEVNLNKVIRSYDENKIYIVDDEGNKVDTVFEPILKYSDNTKKYIFNQLYIMGVLIKPVKALEPNKTYKTIFENGAIRDWGDRYLDFGDEEAYELTFSTGDSSYDMEIGIDDFYIGTQPDITLQFDDVIIRGDSSSNISLKTTNGETVNATVTYEDKLIKLSPAYALQSETQYIIDIPSGSWTYESTGKTNHGYRKMFFTDKDIDEYLISMETDSTSRTVFPEDNINFYAKLTIEPYNPENTKIKDIIAYSWNFGDGTRGEGKDVSHRYTQAGEYIVTLSIDAGPYGSKEVTKKISVLDIDKINLDNVSVSLKSIGKSYDDQEPCGYYSAAVIYRTSLEDAYAVFRVNAYLEVWNWELIDLPEVFEMQYQIYKDGEPVGKVVEGTNSKSNREFVLNYNYLQEDDYEMRFTCVRDSESVEIARIPLIIRGNFEKDLGILINVNNYKALEEIDSMVDYEKNGINNMPKQVIFNVSGSWYDDRDVVGKYNDATRCYIIENLTRGNYTISISENDPVLKAKGTEFIIDLQSFAYKNIDAWVKYPNKIGIDGGLSVDKEAYLNQVKIMNRVFGKSINEESILNDLDEYISDITVIEGVPRKETFEIDVDWNGHQEGYVQISTGDRKWNFQSYEGKAYANIELGLMKVGERLMARAVSYDGEESDWIDLGITCTPVPPLVSNETIEYTTYIDPIGDYNLEANLPFDGHTEGNIPAFDNFSILDKSESFGMGSFNGGLDVSFDGDKATFTIRAEDAKNIKVKSIGREISGGVSATLNYKFYKPSNKWYFTGGHIYMNVIDKETKTVELGKVKIKKIEITPKLTTIITTGIGTKIYIDCSGDEPKFSGIIDLDIGLDVGLDASILGTGLEVWGGGIIGAELHIPTWYLQVDGSAYTKEIVKLFGQKYTIYYGDIYGTWNNGNEKVGYSSNQPYLYALGIEDGVNFEPIGRSYIVEDPPEEMLYASLGENYEIDESEDGNILIDNIYPYPEVKNIAIDGSKWLTYIDDNISRDSLNRTETSLGHVNEMGMLETIWLDDDGTCDFEPVIAGTNSGALVAWQDLNKLLEGDYDLDGISEIEKSCEISVTDGVYESLTDEVGQITLTNDDIYDHSPRLAAQGNEGLLVWQKAYDEGTRMAYAFFNGSSWSDASLVSEEYMSIVNMDISYNNNKGIAVFTLDLDDDFTTEADREIYGKYYEDGMWSESFQLTDNSVIDTEPKCVAVNDDWFITWIIDDGLSYKWLSNDQINVIDDIIIQGISYDMEYKQSLGLITLLYKGEISDQNDTLLLRTYDLNQETWSEERIVTSDYDYIRSFDSAIVESGDMVIDFADVEMMTEVYAGGEIIVPSDNVDLKEMTVSFKHDLDIVEPISLSREVPYKNGEVTIHAVLDNTGDYSERAVVSFYEGDPNIDGSKIGEVDTVDYIPSQGQKEIDVQWIVGSEDKDYYDIYMEVEAYNSTMTNKVFVNRISSYNLSIINVAYKNYGEDEYLITAKILNDSSNPTNNLTVELVDDNGDYSMVKNIETIESLQAYSVDFVIKSSALELDDDIYSIKIIVSPNEELFESNADDNEYVLELEPVELTLLSQSVADNELGIKLDEELKLVFNKVIVEGTKFDQISLRDYKLNVVDIDRIVSNNELTIQPKALLDYNNQYELIVPTESIEAVGGYKMDYDKTIAFHTENNSPEVIFAYPADGLEDVDVDESIRVEFNQTIEKGTSYSDIELIDAAGESIGKSTDINGQWLIIKPNSSLHKETEYYLKLPMACVQNQEGILLSNEVSMTFTTEDELSDNNDTSPTTSSSSKQTNQKVVKVDGMNIGKLSVSSHAGMKKGIVKID